MDFVARNRGSGPNSHHPSSESSALIFFIEDPTSSIGDVGGIGGRDGWILGGRRFLTERIVAPTSGDVGGLRGRDRGLALLGIESGPDFTPLPVSAT